MTAVAGNTLTAAQWNTHVRDNLNETAPGKFTTAHQLFVATGANAGAAYTPQSGYTQPNETLSSTSYANPATTGPQFSVTTGTSAVICMMAYLSNNTAGQSTFASVDITGATPQVFPSDSTAIAMVAPSAGQSARIGGVFWMLALTAGSNQFTMQYRVSGGTGNVADRRLLILPI